MGNRRRRNILRDGEGSASWRDCSLISLIKNGRSQEPSGEPPPPDPSTSFARTNLHGIDAVLYLEVRRWKVDLEESEEKCRREGGGGPKPRGVTRLRGRRKCLLLGTGGKLLGRFTEVSIKSRLTHQRRDSKDAFPFRHESMFFCLLTKAPATRPRPAESVKVRGSPPSKRPAKGHLRRASLEKEKTPAIESR